MRIIFYGAGGIGGNFGGHMARAGLDVTFIARGNHLQAIQANGLRLESSAGSFVINPVKATDDPATVGKADVIFICLKAWQIEPAVEDIRTMLGPETLVIPLQNWIEAADFLASRLGTSHVLGGTCFTKSGITAPGVIRAGGGQITFGELNGGTSARGQRLQQALGVAGIVVENSPEIKKVMWKKFVWISSFGATGALANAAVDAWRTRPEMRATYKALLRESFAVAKASGAPLGWMTYFRLLRSIDKGAEGFKTSMQQDREAGRRSELSFQVGAIVTLGKALNVAVPRSTEVHDALLPSEPTA